MTTQTQPTLDDISTLRDAVSVLKRLGDPAAARVVTDVLALLPKHNKERARCDTLAAIADEGTVSGKDCLYCRADIMKGDLVRTAPAGFAHRECRAKSSR